MWFSVLPPPFHPRYRKQLFCFMTWTGESAGEAAKVARPRQERLQDWGLFELGKGGS